jgi:hypothetical protein
LSGSYLVAEDGGPRSRTGGVSVSLSSPDGHVVGGAVATLIAASPVQVFSGLPLIYALGNVIYMCAACWLWEWMFVCMWPNIVLYKGRLCVWCAMAWGVVGAWFIYINSK